jgi:hypothetical protein
MIVIVRIYKILKIQLTTKNDDNVNDFIGIYSDKGKQMSRNII